MASGSIKFMAPNKGYGFITPDNGDQDVFLHISTIKKAGIAALTQGAKVTYEIAPGKDGKGPKAVNIALA